MSAGIPLTRKSRDFGDYYTCRQYMGSELYESFSTSSLPVGLSGADSRVGGSE